MKFIKISETTKLLDLVQVLGSQDTARILARNTVPWTPAVGSAFKNISDQIVQSTPNVDPVRKKALLNKCTEDSDVFEYIATSSEEAWKMFSSLGVLPNMLRVPDNVMVATSVNVLGNGEGVSSSIYRSVMDMLSSAPYAIDPSIFNEYSAAVSTSTGYSTGATSYNPFVMFQFPWGKISLYSSISGESVDFPVYPDEFEDAVKANYTTMPDLLYQYEPWQVYVGSGPRSIPLTFNFHRDMWTGDHRDGKANELIRFCEANCFPEYNGAAVITPTVTLYLHGKALITGIMTDVQKEFTGPIGLDGVRLMCSLKLNIIEVSETALSYSTVRSKGIIG